MKKQDPQTLPEQLLNWLMDNRATIKARGLADEAGVDNGTVSRWMLGKSTPNATTIDKMATVASKYGFIFS